MTSCNPKIGALNPTAPLGKFVLVTDEALQVVLGAITVIKTQILDGAILTWGQHEDDRKVLITQIAFGNSSLFYPFE